MVQKLEAVKERIINGTRSTKDIDIINEAIEYIGKLERQAEGMPDAALLETREEMFPANIIIESATIYIDTKEIK